MDDLERLKTSFDYNDPWFDLKYASDNKLESMLLPEIDRMENDKLKDDKKKDDKTKDKENKLYLFGYTIKERFKLIEAFIMQHTMEFLNKIDKKKNWVDFKVLLNNDFVDENITDEDFEQVYEKVVPNKGEKRKIGKFIKGLEDVYIKKLNLFEKQFEKILLELPRRILPIWIKQDKKIFRPSNDFVNKINTLYKNLKNTSNYYTIRLQLFDYLFNLSKDIEKPVPNCYDNNQLRILKQAGCSFTKYNELISKSKLMNSIEYYIVRRLINLCVFKDYITNFKYAYYRIGTLQWSTNWIDLLRLRLCLETDYDEKCFENKEEYDRFINEELGKTFTENKVSDLWEQYYSFRPVFAPKEKISENLEKRESKSPVIRKKRSRRKSVKKFKKSKKRI